MRPAKFFYFFFFAAAACLIPFLTLHYQDLGLSGTQIGFLTGIVPLITMVAASVWGMAADASGRHHLLLVVAIAGIWTAVFLLSSASTFNRLIPLVALYALFLAPIIPLVDNAVVAGLGSQKNSYGRVRVWGSYGWGLAALIIGFLIDWQGLRQIFSSYLLMTAILLIVSIKLPVSSISMGSSIRLGLRTLLTNGRWFLFLAVVLVEGMSLGIFVNFLFLHLNDMGANSQILGLSLLFATISEIPIFLYARRLLGRWGAPFILALSLLATAVRAFAYVAMTTPWQVLPISLLHGPTFAAMWVAGVSYADEMAPGGLGATAQGMFSGASMGLGVALGAFSGGYLYETRGGTAAFQWAGMAALLALLVFVMANRTVFKDRLTRSEKAYRNERV